MYCICIFVYVQYIDYTVSTVYIQYTHLLYSTYISYVSETSTVVFFKLQRCKTKGGFNNSS